MKRALIAATLVLLACQVERSATAPSQVAESGVDSAARQPAEATGAAAVPTNDRMIMRSAHMALIVRDAAEVLRKVAPLVESKGGYVAETRQWKQGEQVRATATVHVPAGQLTATLGALRNLAVRTESEHITGQDITKEYTDLGAQLKNLQATETELRELLRTVRERTQKAADVMEVYGEISKVRGEIERIQAHIQFLSQRTAFSMITMELVPDALAAPVVEPGWQPMATVKAASRALVNALKSGAELLIWLVLYVLPLALVMFGAAVLARAAWRKLRRRDRAVQADE